MKTSELEKRLSNAAIFDETLVLDNAGPDLYEFLSGCMKAKGYTRSKLIEKLNVERGYGYQLLNGIRTLSRTNLIKIGLILELDMEHFQRMLKIAQKKPLYVRDMLDAKIFYAIEHCIPYDEAAVFIWGKEDTQSS